MSLQQDDEGTTTLSDDSKRKRLFYIIAGAIAVLTVVVMILLFGVNWGSDKGKDNNSADTSHAHALNGAGSTGGATQNTTDPTIDSTSTANPSATQFLEGNTVTNPEAVEQMGGEGLTGVDVDSLDFPHIWKNLGEKADATCKDNSMANQQKLETSLAAYKTKILVTQNSGEKVPSQYPTDGVSDLTSKNACGIKDFVNSANK